MAFNKDMYIPDQAGALASRYVCFRFTKKFRGTSKQDPQLNAKLKAERPAILNWARKGLIRLRERGHFSPPPDSVAFLNHIKRHSAPVVSFLEEVAEEDPYEDVTVAALYKAFKGWHRERMGAETWLKEIEKFAEAVYTANRIEAGRRDNKPGAPMVFTGLKIKPAFAKHHWPETIEEWEDDEED
jgi:phage/plasmid-associated DNA primase